MISFSDDNSKTSCKLLIVDDSEADRATYRRYLTTFETAGYTFLESDCGEDGLAMSLEHHPDVILLDYLLPDLDGLAFLQTLKTQVHPLPTVIMLTGQGNEQVAVQAMKMGARDYLIKGELKAEQLLNTLRQVLTQRFLQQLLVRQQRQHQLMTDIALRISQSLELDTILATAVEGVRQLLECDRALIYQFAPDMSGTIVSESVLPAWSVSLGANIADTCFQAQGAEAYLAGRKVAIADVYRSPLSPCHLQLLERCQVKAYLVAPIVIYEVESSENRKLWGLFIAHDCHGPRDWQANELALLDNLTVQLAIAIRQSELVSELRSRAESLLSANQRLLDASKLLKMRNRDLDEFAHIASHDLKAPLRAIGNLAQWLKEDLSDDISSENQRLLSLMQSRVKELDKFIEGLLEYSRAGSKNLEPAFVDTRALVMEILDTLIYPTTLQILVPETMPILYTQKLLLQQVLSNLIGNAIKYHHRPDGQVKITAEDKDERVEFAIADNGPGIAAEHHQLIFGVFQTVPGATHTSSTGIGLSIVKKLVERQGGEILLHSALHEGSTFSFTWPKAGC